MSFGWSNLASNQMVSYTDAQGSPYSLKASQSHVTSEQCMDKSATTTKYNVDAGPMVSYASNQLVPKGTWTAGTVYQSAVYSESATKNTCGAGGTGSSVTLTASFGQFTSTVSQADADSQAVTWVQANKQSNANTNGTCTWYNTAQSGNFTRNNCGADATGTTVTYTIAANTYSSQVSQADANTQATNAVNAGGQSYANSNGSCTVSAWYNVTTSGNFTRNNCGANMSGSVVTYTVAAGAYRSTVSQADANQLAQNDVNANGQAYANANGSCSTSTWYSASYSESATKNSCADGGTGSSVTLTATAGQFSSGVSQADANQQAVNWVQANKQANANSNGTCTWYSDAYSANFTRNNCGADATGSVVSFGVGAGAYSSNSSKAHANQQAIDYVNANGQANANSNGTCTVSAWYNVQKSGTFTRTNCGVAYTGGSATYTVSAGAYRSTVSQADADAVAQSHVDTYGQNAVNGTAGGLGSAPAGSCTLRPTAWRVQGSPYCEVAYNYV